VGHALFRRRSVDLPFGRHILWRRGGGHPAPLDVFFDAAAALQSSSFSEPPCFKRPPHALSQCAPFFYEPAHVWTLVVHPAAADSPSMAISYASLANCGPRSLHRACHSAFD